MALVFKFRAQDRERARLQRVAVQVLGGTWRRIRQGGVEHAHPAQRAPAGSQAKGHGHVPRVEQDAVRRAHDTLAELIAAACLRDRRVMAARVRIEKPDVIPNARSVGVEIERLRE